MPADVRLAMHRVSASEGPMVLRSLSLVPLLQSAKHNAESSMQPKHLTNMLVRTRHEAWTPSIQVYGIGAAARVLIA
jgi:hypothetical protein